MKSAALSLILLLGALSAHASSTTIAEPVTYAIYLDSGAIETGKPRPTTHAECLNRAQALVPSGTCVTREKFVNVITCADEKAPSITLVQKDIDGQKYWEIPTGAPAPPVPSEANSWAVMVWAYVHNPAWPAGYPNCWVRGFTPANLWRLNPNYPGTPLLELIVPGQADTREPPNSIEPFVWPGDVPAP